MTTAEYEVEDDGLVKAFKIVDFDTGKSYEVKPVKHRGAVPQARKNRRWGPLYTYLESCEVGTCENPPFPNEKEAGRARQYISKRYKEGAIEVGLNGDNGVVFKIKKKLVLAKSK